MNKNRLKPLIEKYNIKVSDKWKSKNPYLVNSENVCYNYIFRHNEKVYYIGDDDKSLILSYANKNEVFCNYLYSGNDINELEEALKKVIE